MGDSLLQFCFLPFDFSPLTHLFLLTGISLNTQLLYAIVFCARYLDIFWTPLFHSLLLYNFIVKIFYISSSFYILFLMVKVYRWEPELPESGWLSLYCLGFAAISCIPVVAIFEGFSALSFSEVFWAFSIVLESVCVLPQLLLLRETDVTTVINSNYLIALGLYRGLYILNWIYRGVGEHYFDPISVIFGIFQTVIYIDFFIIYKQRRTILLSPSGVIDRGDWGNSFIVGRLIALFVNPPLRLKSRGSGDVEAGRGPASYNDHTSSQRRNDDLADPDLFDDDPLVQSDSWPEHENSPTQKASSRV